MSLRHSRPTSRRSWARVVCSVAVGAALGLGQLAGPAAYADTEDDSQKATAQAEASRAKLLNLSAKAQEAVLALQRTQAQLANAQAVLKAAQAAAAAAEARKAQLDRELAAAQKEEAAGLARIAAIKAEQVKQTDIRDNLARQAYEGAGLERLTAVLNTSSAQDLADNMYVAEKVNDGQNALLTELAANKAKADAEQVKLEATRRLKAQLQLQAQAAMLQAQTARAQAAATQTQLAALMAAQQAQLAAVAAQKADEQARYNELKATSDRLAAELAARGGGGGYGPPPTGSGRFVLPVNGPITSEFEWRINPVLGYRELHTGMDIGAPCGAPVYAAGAGTIVRAAWTGGYGNEIVIDHGGGIATTYNHMSGYARYGGSVSTGDVIGYVGTTGLSTGCHMHFEVRVNGTPVNPRDWI